MARSRKGCPDKSYLTLQFWYEELMKDWPKLLPNQRASLSADLMKMLTNKMKTMPVSPDESKRNVEEMLGILEQLEGKKESKADQVDGLKTKTTEKGSDVPQPIDDKSVG